MTKEQLLRGRELQDYMNHARENQKRAKIANRKPVRWEIAFFDEYGNQLTTIESYGEEEEIARKLAETIGEYYTNKLAELEQEFANL